MPRVSKKTLLKRRRETLEPRDLSFFKPDKFRDYLTITELSRIVNRDVTRLRILEREGKIPKASRVQRGELSIRLWSPEQVVEIGEILKTLKPGRPRNAES
jgi:hypothetical protein